MDTEQLMDELSHCLCSVKTFETEEESWEYTKKYNRKTIQTNL